ncbi:permease-like cell division protein FtsX [Patescibacteria group bacterium]|nr:permease-like cell division protein FtsX [Patescibacteria group bacterium]
MIATKTMWKNVRRSPYQAAAAILIMTLTFLAVSFFTFLVLGSSKIINYFESKPQVTAFFRNEAKQAEMDALKKEIESTGKVSSVKFLSKDQALEIYKDQNKDDPLLLDLVTADILPASLEISTYKIDDLSFSSDLLKKSPIVQEVIFQKDVVATLSSWTNAIRQVGISLIVILSLASIFIMMTIIGMKISQKKEDIEIMTLIGASRWHIRWPFIFEGIFYGVFGAIIGWTIATVGLIYASPFLSTFLKGVPLFPVPLIFYGELLALEIIFAITLGAVASYLAVLRYLK